jgi:hypothetical protein
VQEQQEYARQSIAHLSTYGGYLWKNLKKGLFYARFYKKKFNVFVH